MKLHLNRAVTLLELLIAVVLISVIVLSLSSIDLFSRFHVLSSDRRAKLQNEVSFVLEHMSKEISKAIGNRAVSGLDPISLDNITGDTAINAYIDYDRDGLRSTADRWIAYRFRPASAPPNDKYQVWYCANCTNFPCTTCNPSWGSSDYILSKKIASFTPTYNPGNNYVDINLTGRWQPDQGESSDNPSVTMQTRIKMPSVSTY